MKKRMLSLLLVSVMVCTLLPVNSLAAADRPISEIAEASLSLLYYNEGSYGSVNANDNGAVSIGKIQWHGNRALNLLKNIVNANPSNAKSILGSTLYNEIVSSSSWSSRTVNSTEANAISKLLVTSEGKSAQDKLATSDVTSYINHGINLGITAADALVYFADLENQGGAGNSASVASIASSNSGGYSKITLASIHSAALSHGVMGNYATRRNYTYNYCKNLNWGGSTPDIPDYTVTDFKASCVVRCVSKRVVEAPIGSSKQTRTVYENDTVNVVGYVYNSNDDLYYKTDKGDFIHNVYLEVTPYQQLPPSNYCVAKLKVMRDEKHINDYPDSDAPTIKTVKYGDTVDVVGYVYNAPGSLWYAVRLGEETGFIQSNYLSVVSADRRTPSDYANTKLEVCASEKSVYSSPYSSSTLCEKKSRGDIFNTIGYVYNRYGNLWYIDDSEHCIYSSYLKSDVNANLPSNYDFIELRAADGKIYKSRPYDVASTEGNLGAGDTVKSVGYVINVFGNKWYECENGHFIYDSNLSPSEYVIAYNANGGSGTMSNTTGKHGESITFNNCTFTRTGYEFAGWNLYRTNDNKWHTQSNGWKTEKEIAENGYIKSVYCDGCSGRLDYSWANGCSDADEYVLYAIWEEAIHTHSYIAVVTAHTCTEQGYTTYTCECGESYVADYVAALGHNYVDGICTHCGEKDPTPGPITNAGKLVVSDARARAGEEVTVSVSIENNPGIMVMALGIDYDKSKLELVGYEDGIMTGWKVATNAVWIGADDVTANGVILKLKFKVLEDVEDGDVQISMLFSEGDIANHNEDIIMPGISNGTITVYSPVPGDVTGDGKVNALDLVRLQRYLSGEDVVIGGSCDITGDGKINALDLVRLQRYLSGEDVVVC